MDIQMPEMDGLEATKIIKRRGFQDPRIIVITSLKNYRETCLAAGADDFLTEPLGIEKLREAIECQMTIPSFMPGNLEEITATLRPLCDITK
jgi:CheY-like chemotaxis protein